jgi:ABC-type transport system involved in cytochrome c biogenesis permease subunit
MRFGLGVLALLVAATVPAFIVAGGTSLRGLGWFLVIGAAVVVLIDFTDRVTDWIERRRWGRRR